LSEPLGSKGDAIVDLGQDKNNTAMATIITERNMGRKFVSYERGRDKKLVVFEINNVNNRN
jgi:hypothetical protein